MTEEATQVPLSVDDLGTGDEVKGKVSYLAVYGAMIDIGLERDALLHVSQLGRDVRNAEEAYTVGDEVTAYVLKVDKENRVALTLEKPPALPWSKIKQGETYTGTVTRIENYGAFVDIGAERDGMVHVSELTDGYVQSPSDVVSVGKEVEVRVLKVNRKKRQIDLSMKTPMEEISMVFETQENVPTAMEIAMRRAQKAADKDRRQEEGDKGGKKKERRQQDDIIQRTLRKHSSN